MLRSLLFESLSRRYSWVGTDEIFPAEILALAADAGRTYEVWPKIRFDARTLSHVQESFPTTVFSLSVDGAMVGQQSQTVRVRSVNDVPFA